MEHKLDRDVQPDLLAEEIAAAHGWAEAPTIRTRPPGQVDEDGEPLDGVLLVDRDDVDPKKLAEVLTSHAPAETVAPLTNDEISKLRDLLSKSA